MKNLKNTIIVSSYLLLIALFFGGGYALGRIGTDSKENEMPLPTTAAVETIAENENKSPYYEVKTENGRLVIYKCIGDNKQVIASEEISENIFPKDDIEELKEGVQFDRLEKAQQMFENFVS